MSRRRVLVAERGPMAGHLGKVLRVMGLETVTVFGDGQEEAPYVDEHDFAVYMGPRSSPSTLIDMANDAGCDALHPGLSRLAEDPGFALSVARANLLFIGPDHEKLNMLSDRWTTRQAAERSKVPVIQGSGLLTGQEQAAAAVEALGLPVWIKDSRGRLAQRLETREQVLEAVEERLQAQERVWIEAHVRDARHVVVTVVGDSSNTVVPLGPRERARRRGGRLSIDQFPASVSQELAGALDDAAVAIAKACSFAGVGSVGFLVDPSGAAWCIGLRPRMQLGCLLNDQVQGVRLIEAQLRVAYGDAVGWTRADLRADGVALGFRIRATTPGSLTRLEAPEGASFFSNAGVGVPVKGLIGVLVVHAPTRQACVVRGISALRALKIEGVETDIQEHIAAASDVGFWEGLPQAKGKV